MVQANEIDPFVKRTIRSIRVISRKVRQWITNHGIIIGQQVYFATVLP